MAGSFQNLFSAFLTVFPVLWLLVCSDPRPHSLEISPGGIQPLVLHCQHPEGTMTPMIPALEDWKGEKGIWLKQDLVTGLAPEKFS